MIDESCLKEEGTPITRGGRSVGRPTGPRARAKERTRRERRRDGGAANRDGGYDYKWVDTRGMIQQHVETRGFDDRVVEVRPRAPCDTDRNRARFKSLLVEQYGALVMRELTVTEGPDELVLD